MTDENGNILPYANDPVVLDISGPIELIGPTVISLSGGMGGTYVRSTGKSGNGILEVITPDGLSQKINFTV
jgi:beta-galactosidase